MTQQERTGSQSELRAKSEAMGDFFFSVSSSSFDFSSLIWVHILIALTTFSDD